MTVLSFTRGICGVSVSGKGETVGKRKVVQVAEIHRLTKRKVI